MQHVKCDLCENDNYTVLGPVKENKLVKCDLCGHIYLPFRTDPEDMKDFYGDSYFNESYIKENEKVQMDYLNDKPNILKFVEKRFATLHKYQKPGEILDIGCAMGFYLEYAEAHGWETWGIEISQYAAEYARKLLKSAVIINETIEKAEFEPAKFDVVTLWLVFEHMTHPVETLKKVNQWLKKGGIIGLKVPNADGITFRTSVEKWLNQHPIDHYCDYTPDTLRRMLLKAGFETLEFETEGIYLDRATSDEETRNSPKIEAFYGDLAKRANLGDSLVVFAEKK